MFLDSIGAFSATQYIYKKKLQQQLYTSLGANLVIINCTTGFFILPVELSTSCDISVTIFIILMHTNLSCISQVKQRRQKIKKNAYREAELLIFD